MAIIEKVAEKRLASIGKSSTHDIVNQEKDP